jgi:hypothetical protein
VKNIKEIACPNIFLLCVGICTFTLMFWTMNYGPGISPDSTKYFAVARNLISGNGFYESDFSVSHYPPVYPILLAIVNIFNTGDNLLPARLLHALLFSVNVCLVVYAVQKSTNHSLWASILILLVYIVSAPLILIYSMAWSESPFIIFSIFALLLCSYFCLRPSTKLLLATSIISSLAITTRYIGLTLLPTIILGIVIFGNHSIKDKIRDTIITIGITCLPIGIWIFSNLIATESATDRSFAIHPIDLGHIETLIETLYFFVFPVQFPKWLQAVVIFGIALAFLISTIKLSSLIDIRKEIKSSIRIILFSLCITFFFAYIAFLMISISFFDAHTPLDFRILAPAFLTFEIAFIILIWSLFRHTGQELLKWGLLSIAILSIALNSRSAILRAIDIHNHGRGYSSKAWRNSDTVHYLKSSSIDSNIYTNGADVIRFWIEMEATVLPQKIEQTTLIANDEYTEQMQILCDDVKEGDATIIFFTSINRSALPTLDELGSECDLPILVELGDGIIFGNP